MGSWGCSIEVDIAGGTIIRFVRDLTPEGSDQSEYG